MVQLMFLTFHYLKKILNFFTYHQASSTYHLLESTVVDESVVMGRG